MKLKLNQILAGVLVLQIALGAVVFWPRSTQAAGGTLFADLDPASVTSILLEDDTGAAVELVRLNGNWVLPQYDNYPALETEVNTLFTDLLAIPVGETVTSSEASQAALQVADDNFLRRVTLTSESGETHVLYLGSSPTYGATHFRIGGQPDTHLAASLDVNSFNARASDWIDAVYLRVDQENLAGLTLQNALGTLTFSKDAAGSWQMDGLQPGEVQNDAEINSLLGRTTAITMTTPIGLEEDPAWGFDSPLAVLTFTTTGGEVTLMVGAQDPDDLSYVIKSSASDWYARVREFSVSSLVDYSRESFLELPTATPTVDPALLPAEGEAPAEGEMPMETAEVPAEGEAAATPTP